MTRERLMAILGHDEVTSDYGRNDRNCFGVENALSVAQIKQLIEEGLESVDSVDYSTHLIFRATQDQASPPKA